MPGGYNTTLYLRNESVNLYPVCYTHTIDKQESGHGSSEEEQSETSG